MSRQSWEVLWSPNNPNKFIKYNTSDINSDVVLYSVFSSDDDCLLQSTHNKSVYITEDILVYPIADCSEFSSVKSVAWCPQKNLADYCVLAVGSSNGRVSLLNIGDAVPSNTGLAFNQDFAPKAERTCHELAWNEQETNLLAVGLDKVRYDNSLLVWDVEAKSVITQSPGYDSRSFGLSKKPVFEHGASESTVSIQWLPNKPRTLLAGQGTKWLRLFDIRAPDPKIIATTKAINGISVDKHNPNRIASFAEGAVLVWDMRNYEKPLATINQSKPVSKIQWCPTRGHMLSVLQKDSTAVNYYDLQYLSGNKHNIDEESESIIYERTAHLPKSSKSTITSFSWHPSAENTILTISASGELSYLKIYEKIAMSWSPSLELIWGCGKYMISCSNLEEDVLKDQDISYVMKQRALAGYGVKSILKDENQISKVLESPSLTRLWEWLQRASRTKDSEARKTRKFLGVKAIIKEDMASVVQSCLDDKMQEDYPVTPKYYSSSERTSALKLCDWDISETNLKDRLYKMAVEGEPERAAAMALFNNKLHLTIDLLSFTPPQSSKKPIDSSLPIVAMALSGFSEKRHPLWIANCKNLSTQLKNPYLRAIFAFLTAEEEDYSIILKEKDIELRDKMAFACRYLNDTKLVTFIENVTSNFVANGNLEGLLLTGLTSDGLDLLENFINKTSDVQTAILMILNTKVIDAVKDPRVNDWIENYRDLLDQWRLWHERAHFDALVQNTCGNRKIPQQISVTCTYCSKPVSHNLISSGGMRGSRQLHGMGTNSRQNKAISCPNCRQPLPRCSICLINMGSLSSHAQKHGSRGKNEYVVNSFLNWFTWCQMCRHGGHAVHLMEWFADHLDCPVTGCNCTCNVHDSVAMVNPIETVETN